MLDDGVKCGANRIDIFFLQFVAALIEIPIGPIVKLRLSVAVEF